MKLFDKNGKINSTELKEALENMVKYASIIEEQEKEAKVENFTMPGLYGKPLKDYRKSLRRAIGFMNTHRDPENEHDDGSEEYYIRRDLTELAVALEGLADRENPGERDKEGYGELLGRLIVTDEELEVAKKEWSALWKQKK